MSNRVLVPMDESEMAENALRFALETHPDAAITVFHVVGEPSPMMGKALTLALEDDVEQAGERHAEQIFSRARTLASEYGIAIVTKTGYGQPAKAIVNQADDYDLIILGTHGGSLADTLFVGNVAERVFHRSPVPVTVVR